MATVTRTAYDYLSAADSPLYSSRSVPNSTASIAAGSGQGQSFVGDGRILDSVKYFGYTFRDGTIEIRIYAHSGTYGSSSVGTGSPLAVSETVTFMNGTVDKEIVRFTGSNRIVLESGTNYVVLLYNIDLNGNFIIYTTTRSDLFSGNRCSFDGTTFTSASNDALFSVYTASAEQKVIVAKSALGSGVSNQTTISLKPLTMFEPPANDRYSWANYREHTPDHELFGYVRQGTRAQNIFYLVDGTFTNVDPLNPAIVRKVYLGGHQNKVDANEIAALTEAGYGAYIS